MAYTLLDVLFKLSQNRRPTSSTKRLLEEVARYTPTIIGQQIWRTEIDPSPAIAVSQGTVILDTDLAMTADPTTPFGEINSVWLAGYEQYIPANIVPGDLGYTTVIKDNAGTIIPDGKQDAYGLLFLHSVGVLLVQNPTGFASEYSFPPKLTAYRYNGMKGVTRVSVDGGSFFDTYLGTDGVDGGTF